MARLKDGSTVGGSEILTEGNLESLLGYLPLDPQDLTWSKLSGKPSTFTPSAHTHPWSEVTGKPTTFAPSAHTHSISDVAGLRAELDSIPELTKANVGLGNVDNVKQASKTEHDQLVSNFSTHQADLTSQEVGKGADIIGLPDPNNLFTATNVGGAMSELFTNVSDGKSLVGGAITGVDDSVVIPTEPSFADLASAIGGISTGKKWASGSARSSSNLKILPYYRGTQTTGVYPLEVSGLSFRPSIIFASFEYYSGGYMINYSTLYINNRYYVQSGYVDRGSGGDVLGISSDFPISSKGFVLPVKDAPATATFNWIAIE